MIRFCAYGHENILATHKTTLEFTKDSFLTKKGDCIIGINSDFDLTKIKKFIKNKIKIKIKIKLNKKEEVIIGNVNNGFNDNKEIVIRKSAFKDERTLMTNSNKAACDIDIGIINKLKSQTTKLEILLTN